MKQNVYDFTKDTIKKFQEVGADIGMVQVGNEITNGMLDIMPDRSKGETYKDTWGNAKNAKILCGYLKAGIKAVRECTPKALVTLHLESMGYGKCSEIMMHGNKMEWIMMFSAVHFINSGKETPVKMH